MGIDLPEDVSNQGRTTSRSSSAMKNWGKLKTAVSVSESIKEAVAPPSVSGSSNTNVHPSMERMATKRHLNHAPVFSNVRVAESETVRFGSIKSSGEKSDGPRFLLYPWNKYNKLWW